MSARAKALAAIVGLLIVAVAIDQLFLGRPAAAADATAADTPAARYRAAAQRLATKRALIESRSEFEAMLADAEAAWRDASRNAIRASTGELAAAQFRDRVTEVAGQHGATGLTVTTARARPVEGAAGVEVLELTISFDVASAADAFSLIDMLENMPELDTAIRELKVAGPGRLPQERFAAALAVSVDLTLHALAIVGSEA